MTKTRTDCWVKLTISFDDLTDDEVGEFRQGQFPASADGKGAFDLLYEVEDNVWSKPLPENDLANFDIDRIEVREDDREVVIECFAAEVNDGCSALEYADAARAHERPLQLCGRCWYRSRDSAKFCESCHFCNRCCEQNGDCFGDEDEDFD